MIEMRKKAAVAAAAFALALCALLAGCSGGSGLDAGLPEWADEAAVTQEVQAIIEDFSARDYEAAAAKGQAIGLTADQLQGAGDTILDSLGALTGFADVAYANAEDASGNAYAVVIQIAEYENGSAQYTVSLYEDGSLAGFYVK